jgi:hypothetical protein
MDQEDERLPALFHEKLSDSGAVITKETFTQSFQLIQVLRRSHV